MKKILAIWAVLFLQACSPSVVNVDPAASRIVSRDTVVYVARFEGGSDYVDAATELFAAELEQQIGDRVVVGPAVLPESSAARNDGKVASVADALDDAKANGADLLIMGKVAGHQTTGALHGFSTVEVFNVQSGNRIANFHRPSGNAVTFNVHQTIMAAVKRTAADVATLFDE